MRIAAVSHRENWKLRHCASVTWLVEQAPSHVLDVLFDYFDSRSIHGRDVALPASLMPPAFGDLEPAHAHANEQDLPDSLAALYRQMLWLESSVTNTPDIGCGVQGVRLMRTVALMSRAPHA